MEQLHPCTQGGLPTHALHPYKVQKKNKSIVFCKFIQVCAAGKKKIEKAAQVCHCAILQPTGKMEMQKSYQELYPAPEQSLYTSDIQRS